ncbi:MAG: CHAT domain-containing protein [Trichodesmium sp. St2_bin6]|nr:CHAT domain-containing protein [Trichodesmium sp. St4_bin8_1]MDE5073299.1 CHAT domain-containing protein [Trichodesmium sp. St5_bin8]MDE5078588.1 CHAT domain-containing protein [Trichodesmium sp. St2_bin6]MDE5103819.1 CHAT domain-containing protein [Trichodesmium sp. St19_bin2]
MELVVLSACETALAYGDGVKILGLGYAVQKSRVNGNYRDYIATLWKVKDQSTKTLMTNFYNELTKGVSTTAKALRSAQICLIKSSDSDHAYYWSPFLLIGNGL